MSDELALGRIQQNPPSAAVYERLLAELQGIGEFAVENKKTSLHVTHGRAFLGVHPRRGGLLLNIVLSRPLENPRLKKSEQVSANRYHHEVELSAPADLDAEACGWIREAYALTTG